MERTTPRTTLQDRLARRELDELGGEPLEGSGFEDEAPEPVTEQAAKPV